MKDTVVKIGMIGVDAGLVWIGDPCYVLHSKTLPKAIGKSWFEFCEGLSEKFPTMKSFNYDLGHEGLGVCVSSGRGDGTYPVYALVGEEGDWGKRIKKVWINFIDDEEKGPTEDKGNNKFNSRDLI